MSIRVMTAVWDMELPAKDKLVLLALADCANDEGLAWPSIATLARKCGCDQRTIQRNLRDLEKRGLFAREEVIGKGCRYVFDPRQIATRGKSSPVTKTTKTPGKLPPKPSRTVIKPKEGARAHELPLGWVPKPFGPKTKSRGVVDGWPPGEFETQLEHFTAHPRSRGSKFKDWQDAWSTWVLNYRKFNRGSQNGRAATNHDEPQNAYVRAALSGQSRREAERAAAEFG
jgi:hypothetical protein